MNYLLERLLLLDISIYGQIALLLLAIIIIILVVLILTIVKKAKK